jgi:hypothetical protein
MAGIREYNPLEYNFLYISHLDEQVQYWCLPTVPERISDSMSSTFSNATALGRSAPIYTYSNSGPRTVQVELPLHRDMMDELNVSNSATNNILLDTASGQDYVDALVRALQAVSVPKYTTTTKAIEPPLVALRLSNSVFIKGIVEGNIGVEYNLPIQADGKYAQVKVSFSITEVDPYDASSIYKNGSFRGVVSTLRDRMGLGVSASSNGQGGEGNGAMGMTPSQNVTQSRR